MMERIYWSKVAYIKVARKEEEKGAVPKAGTIFSCVIYHKIHI